tara:strand:+ start:700 stop:1161 length:462 start_codon:yes stop_codon:yes gene_type:complete
MSTKNRVFSRLFDSSKHTTELKKAEAKLNAKKKVALGLVDELDYDYMSLQDEIGRLSYSVEEWFDEKFEEFYQLRSDLRSVYLQNSEAFLSVDDVSADKDRLEQIRDKAIELGLEADDVYPDWNVHYNDLEYLEQLESRFEDQVGELRSIGVE